MSIYQWPGSKAQIRQGLAWPPDTGSAPFGQCDLFRASVGLCVAWCAGRGQGIGAGDCEVGKGKDQSILTTRALVRGASSVARKRRVEFPGARRRIVRSARKNWARWPSAWLTRKTSRRRTGCSKRWCGDSTARNPKIKIRRHVLPQQFLSRLFLRARQRNLAADPLILMACWLETEPEAPDGKRLKRFPGFALCGEAEFHQSHSVPWAGT